MIHLSFGNIPGADLKMFHCNALKINNWSLCIKIFSACFFFFWIADVFSLFLSVKELFCHFFGGNIFMRGGSAFELKVKC